MGFLSSTTTEADIHSVAWFITCWLPEKGTRYLARHANPALDLSTKDLVQEVALRALKWRYPEGIEDPRAFANKIARNVVRDAKRKAKRRIATKSVHDGDGNVVDHRADSHDKTREEEARRIVDILFERIRGRPADVAHAYFETGSYEAAARLLGMEPATVRMNYSRFCGMVRKCADLKSRFKEALMVFAGVLAASTASASEAYSPSKRLKKRLISGALASSLLFYGRGDQAILRFLDQVEPFAKTPGAVGGGANAADLVTPTADIPVI